MVRPAKLTTKELAVRYPDWRNANLVERHGRVVWIPDRVELFTDTPIPDAAEGDPQFITADPALMPIAIEEGTRADYLNHTLTKRWASAIAMVCYLAAGAFYKVDRRHADHRGVQGGIRLMLADAHSVVVIWVDFHGTSTRRNYRKCNLSNDLLRHTRMVSISGDGFQIGWRDVVRTIRLWRIVRTLFLPDTRR